MVVLNKIYTKTGDGGETALGDGSRVSKCSLRVETYGTVDELNAVVGLARSISYSKESYYLNMKKVYHVRVDSKEELEEWKELCNRINYALSRISNDLFDLGADLCRPGAGEDPAAEGASLRVTARQVERLESEIDKMNANLRPLNSFVLPGGTELAARLHLCRTVARRAERRAVALAGAETETIRDHKLDRVVLKGVNPEAVRYLNRLSDWFFVAARVANANGALDELWEPGATR